MNGANGIDIAKELRRSDTDCLLIFTTTSTDHALEGFQVRALHYLVKPYSENDISALADEIPVSYTHLRHIPTAPEERIAPSRGKKAAATAAPAAKITTRCV